MIKMETFAIKWLNNNYSDLEIFEIPEHPNYIFHMKNKKCILQHDKKTGVVYLNYEIWSFFESYFSMDYKQIQDLTKKWVEEQYKVGLTTTRSQGDFGDIVFVELKKLNITTTEKSWVQHAVEVKELYKIKKNDKDR